MKTNERNPSSNPAKAAPAAAGVITTPSAQSIPKTDLQPNVPPNAQPASNVVTIKPAPAPVKAGDTSQPVAPSLGKGRDADLPPAPKPNKDASGNRWQQPT